MDLALLVYAISLLTPIGTVAMFIAIISCIAICGLMLYRVTECTQESWRGEREVQKRAEKGVWVMGRVWFTMKVLIPTVIVLILLPTPKTAYIMVGAYAAQKIVENKSVQDTGGKVLTLINQKLDHYIEEGIEEATKVSEKAKGKAKKAVE